MRNLSKNWQAANMAATVRNLLTVEEELARFLDDSSDLTGDEWAAVMTVARAVEEASKAAERLISKHNLGTPEE